MVQNTANSLAGGQSQVGGQLLQELEALNQALYQAGQQQGTHNNVSSKRLAKRESMLARVEDADVEKLLRSSHPKPPVRAKSSLDAGKKGDHNLSANEFEDDEVSLTFSESGTDGDSVDFRQRLDVATEKKKGLWSWKPFRALAHVGQQKYNCLFTVHVHGIEGLPASVNGLRLGVHFAKKDDVGVQTMPSRVSHGHCEFQETLHTRCSLHGTKNGAKVMKWESKQFVLTVIALDVDELVLGRHKLELTRLLPESIEDDVVKQDTWTTTLKLSGKAQGGTLIVTFGCEIQSKDPGNVSASSSARFGESPVLRAVRSFNSLPNSGNATPSRHVLEDHQSPAMSEPSAEYHGMEHLSLDDFNHEGLYRGSMHADPQAASLEDFKAHGNVHAGEEEEEEEEEEEVEFTVIDKGVEVSTIVDTVSGRGYDSFESENASNFEEKQVDVSSPGELSYSGREAEDRYEEYEDKDVKDESSGAVGEDLMQAKEHVKEVDDHKDSGSQSESFPDSKLVPRSIDDELEMQELLAALGGQERETGGKKGADTPNDLDVKDDMTEEELLSLFPAGIQWESAKKVPQSKGLESDDEFDNVAGEFLSLLESDAPPSQVPLTPDSEPDSPRALLFKQFEKEAMIESGLGLNMKMPELPSTVEQSEVPDFYLDGVPRDRSIDPRLPNEPHSLPTHQYTNSEDFNNLGWGSEEDVELASIMEAAESELQKATQTMRSKNRAKLLEDEETEALMQEWGLNKKVFEGSSRTSSYADDTGNSFAMVAFEPPPLGFGLGPVVPLRDGGSLMSMNPYNFQATSGSKLVMQVSKPVVVPTEMGAQSLDILLRMASSGMDGMSNQAMVTMPLDDITGKSVEQIASEGFAAFRGNHLGGGEYGYPAIEGGHSPYSLEYTQDSSSRSHGALTSQTGSGLMTSTGRTNTRKSNPNLGDDAFASLEDLAPVAMQKIEALALEGLKIQADMAEEEAPYLVEPFSKQGRIEGGYSARQGGGKSEVNYLEDATSMSILDDGTAEDSGISDDFSMAISLDEWMRLDAGVVDETDIQDDTMALVAAHHATHGDIVPSTSDKQAGKQKADGTNDKGGHMGNTITLAMLVQLRDPLRNFEPIGAPMMALVQAERVAVPPMPKLRFGKQISLRGNNERYDDPPAQPLFKITDVTLSGLKTSDETATDKKNQKQIGWGNPKQQQSGSRWLAASGMANKNAKVPISKAKSIPLSHSAASHPAPRPVSHPAASLPAPRPAAPPAAFPAPSKSSPSKIDSLWSLSAKITSRWGGGAPSVTKVRNPDVVMSKTGWFGRKK